MKRLLALLMVGMMLPLAALAEPAAGVRFHVQFQMEPDAYPADVRDTLAGLAELLNMTALDGVHLTAGGAFDTQLNVTLNGKAGASFHVTGNEANWFVQSPLFGEETLHINMLALLEFAMKGYAHLGVPLQRAAILLTPYAHTSGVGEVVDAAKPYLFAEEGTRDITPDRIAAMANDVAEAASGRAFRYWAQALAMETGYDMDITLALSMLPMWVESFVPSEGIHVAVSDDAETWTAGPLTLFTRRTDRSGAQQFAFTPPPLWDGSTLTLEGAFQPDSDLLHGSVDLLILDAMGETVLDLHTDGSLPVALPVTRAFSLTWDADGKAVGGDGVHLYFEAEATDQGMVLRQMTPDRQRVMLTVTARMEEASGEVQNEWLGGVNVFSLNGDTLAELMRTIAEPLTRGMFPLLVEAPFASCQTIMDLLEDSGVFGMLINGLGDDAEAWDEGEADW